MNKTLLSLLLLLQGCCVGPNYFPPVDIIPDQWVATETFCTELSVMNTQPSWDWWKEFNDPFLDKYIALATSFNNNFLAAEINIVQARALRQVAVAPLFPKTSVDLDGFHLFLSQNGPIDALTSIGGRVQPPFQSFNIFNTFIDASWELDLFGKTRRGIEAAQAQLESTIEQRNDLLVSICAEVAANYIALRSSQQHLFLLEENIDLLRRVVQISHSRYSAGYSNLLDLEQMNIQLQEALVELPAVKTEMYRAIFALSVLIGELPECLLDELLPVQLLPQQPNVIAVGVKSDLLRRRPDIRAAERNLAQSTANIGVAVGSFYPSLTLTGIFGLDSLKLSNLYTPNSKSWIYGADVNMPIFQGGKLIGNLRIAEAEAAATAFHYQQTVLKALQETEGVLVAYVNDLSTLKQMKEIVAVNEKLTKLTSQRYHEGLVNQTDNLNSHLTWNHAKLNLLQVETTALLDLISLYKALAGWNCE